MKYLVSLLLAVAITFSMSSCGGSSSGGSDEVTILYPNWAEGIAFTYLAKVALEDHDYAVDLINLEPGLIYGELSKSNSKGDVFLDAWLPYTHEDYWNDYGDDLVKLGESFSEGTTGLVVPSYVEINSIEELNAHRDRFGGEIIGIGSGAGIHRNTLKAIEEYDLDFEQVTSSGPAMIASLDKAVKNNDWIVITGWKPHFKWSNFDLKYLDDPKGVYPMDVCAIISRRGFEEDMPEVADFFKKFNLEEEQLYSLMAAIDEDGEEAGAQKWYEANQTLVDGWFE
ncbi:MULTISPECIES: glycine betaine ABC transporter substrate-binding protein [Proteiniphilum]|uniref:glycine betaine ABC transporter substrate-binding protein n=1 Tax=Proteiniphilum TaxID=294702 RepID=UPI0028AD03B8|nr:MULTISPECIES: glycine betaine ABC transporter substrate-binding protein [Proteiniphilum]MDY9918016.1 glycine betaine ABC transporter substrate-binding protein [Proteiniphilum sp.]